MLELLIEFVVRLIAKDDAVEMDYDRCRRCTTDLSHDLAAKHMRCSKCGKRIQITQRIKWKRHNREEG